MSTIYAGYRDSGNNWSQYAPSVGITSDAKNDQVFNIKNYSGEFSIFAWVSNATDTRVYIKKVDRNGTITELDDSGNAYFTITSGNGHDIFLCFDRSQTNLYVGVHGETTIWKFTVADLTNGTHITGSITGGMKAMKIDKNGLVTCLGGANIVNQFDNTDSDNQVTTDVELFDDSGNYSFGEYTAIYFDQNNDLVTLLHNSSNNNYYIGVYDQTAWAEESLTQIVSYYGTGDTTYKFLGMDILTDTYGNNIALLSMYYSGDDTSVSPSLSNFRITSNTEGVTAPSRADITSVNGDADNRIDIKLTDGTIVCQGTDTGKTGGTVTLSTVSNGWSGTIDIIASATEVTDSLASVIPKHSCIIVRSAPSISIKVLEFSYVSSMSNIFEYYCNLNTDYEGNYYYSKYRPDGTESRIYKLLTDGGSGTINDMVETYMLTNASNLTFKNDITGLDVSAIGSSGR